jgi:hypothetical protein
VAVPRLVGALPSEPHAQLPIGLGKVREAPGGALQPDDFFIHLAMDELHL